MAELDIAQATTTDLENIDEFNVNAERPDAQGSGKETVYSFPDAAEQLGYYKHIPELKKAIDALAIWTVGKGWTADTRTEVILNSLIGWGEDSFQSICQNLIIQKKIFGDAFAEIIRNEQGTLINLKPLFPGDIKVYVDNQGIVNRYEQVSNTGGKKKTFQPNEILHLCNDRIANEIHGMSVVDSVKWVIDARNEAMQDERKIRHRELALGILYVDTDDTSKISDAKDKYKDAVENGEVLVLGKDVAEIADNPNTPRDRLQWIQYLENFFYQAVGVPRVIATSENYTEAASKVGFLTFEPIYTQEQTLLEADLWNQTAIKVKFNRPPSLSGVMQESEEKNTGQTGFQPNEVKASVQRNE